MIGLLLCIFLIIICIFYFTKKETFQGWLPRLRSPKIIKYSNKCLERNTILRKKNLFHPQLCVWSNGKDACHSNGTCKKCNNLNFIKKAGSGCWSKGNSHYRKHMRQKCAENNKKLDKQKGNQPYHPDYCRLCSSNGSTCKKCAKNNAVVNPKTPAECITKKNWMSNFSNKSKINWKCYNRNIKTLNGKQNHPQWCINCDMSNGQCKTCKHHNWVIKGGKGCYINKCEYENKKLIEKYNKNELPRGTNLCELCENKINSKCTKCIRSQDYPDPNNESKCKLKPKIYIPVTTKAPWKPPVLHQEEELSVNNANLGCGMNPPSPNAKWNPNNKGCDGARYTSGTFGAGAYCKSEKGKFPWYNKCCKFVPNYFYSTKDKCINKNEPPLDYWEKKALPNSPNAKFDRKASPLSNDLVLTECYAKNRTLGKDHPDLCKKCTIEGEKCDTTYQESESIPLPVEEMTKQPYEKGVDKHCVGCKKVNEVCTNDTECKNNGKTLSTNLKGFSYKKISCDVPMGVSHDSSKRCTEIYGKALGWGIDGIGIVNKHRYDLTQNNQLIQPNNIDLDLENTILKYRENISNLKLREGKSSPEFFAKLRTEVKTTGKTDIFFKIKDCFYDKSDKPDNTDKVCESFSKGQNTNGKPLHKLEQCEVKAWGGNNNEFRKKRGWSPRQFAECVVDKFSREDIVPDYRQWMETCPTPFPKVRPVCTDFPVICGTNLCYKLKFPDALNAIGTKYFKPYTPSSPEPEYCHKRNGKGCFWTPPPKLVLRGHPK
jgi:hypothetical protein